MLKSLWSRRLLFLIILFLLVGLVSGCQTKKKSTERASVPKFLSGYLVETERLQSLLNQPNLTIIDARAQDVYQKSHIPTAVNLPKNLFRTPEDLEYKKKKGFAISPEKAERIFGEAGIGKDTMVIVYDSVTFPDASVIWTILVYYGHNKVQVLKGGYEKWAAEGRPTTTEPPQVQRKIFKVKPRPEMVATTDYLLKHKQNLIHLDMRTFEEYLGLNPAGNPRGGSIPGAIHIEWVELAGNSTVKPVSEVQEILERYGVTKDKEIVTYCNWGIGRGTYGFMVLKMLGYKKVRVYGGSMEDWSSRKKLKMGDTTNIPTNL